MSIVAEQQTQPENDLTEEEEKRLEELEVHRETWEFSPEAESKIASHLINDAELCEWACTRIKPEYFRDGAHIILWRTASRLFLSTKTLPTYEIVDLEMREAIGKKQPEEQFRIRAKIRETYDYCYGGERAYVRMWLTEWVKKSRTQRAMFEYLGKNDQVAFRREMEDIWATADDGGYDAWDAVEFLDYADNLHEDWLVENWLPKGSLLLCAGEQKLGKSTLGFSLIAALVSGRDWHGMTTTRSPVILLDYENPKDYTAVCLRRYLDQQEWSAHRKRLVVPQRLPGAMTAEWLRQFMRANPSDGEKGLVIIDSARRAFNGLFAGIPNWENSASAVDQALKPLLDLARDTGWTMMIIHHQNKTGSTSGSTDWEACPDYIWSYDRDSAGQRRLSIKGRLTRRVEPLVFDWDETTGVIVAKGLAAAKAAAAAKAEESDREKLLACIPLSGDGVDAKYLMGASGIKKTRLYDLLRQAEEQLEVCWREERTGIRSTRYYWRKP